METYSKPYNTCLRFQFKTVSDKNIAITQRDSFGANFLKRRGSRGDGEKMSGSGYDLLTELPITNGNIHFIRLVNEKGYINIFNENFYISKELSFEYIWTTIFTKKQELKFFHKETKESYWTMIKTVEYNLRETVKNNIPGSHFC